MGKPIARRPVLVTCAAVGRLAGVTPATVENSQLPKVASGRYNLLDPAVWDYVTRSTVARAQAGGKTKEALDRIKLQKDIELKTAQIAKVNLATEKERASLVPADMVAIWIGHFSAEIRVNLLTISKRVAGGDDDLRRRIDEVVKKSLEKTLENAERKLRETDFRE